MAIVKTEDLTPQGRAARNRAITRLRAAIADHAEVQARWDNAAYLHGNAADQEKLAAHNELLNARAPFTPQFGRYELPEDLQESKWKGLV